MLAQHYCDSEGNITGLRATACNCLSVPYGNSASCPDMQSLSNSNRANLVRGFPFQILQNLPDWEDFLTILASYSPVAQLTIL